MGSRQKSFQRAWTLAGGRRGVPISEATTRESAFYGWMIEGTHDGDTITLALDRRVADRLTVAHYLQMARENGAIVKARPLRFAELCDKFGR